MTAVPQTGLSAAPEPATHVQPIRVAALSDVPPGWVLKVRVGSREIALANCDGTITALENACTHAGGPLGDNRLHEGCYIECPWHNAVFDARTGDVLHGPARKGARMYPVTVQDGTIFVVIDLGPSAE